ncbi:cytochrome c oxidase subunit 3 [Uliginosibacterium sp. H3]|uniref:cytochrome-c oxidase n=1 Tax=Uliginosibacterium silvisoli TaxID=3114758 RepID=A0ABU6K2F5_9RHOO|nr:cytochrome c oxidase subunit 3 [Uliginosibacterium sp. H3]
MSQTTDKYFVPEPSTYPLIGSLALLLLGAGASFWVNHLDVGPWLVAAGFAVLIYMLFAWFGAVAGESESGKYGTQVDKAFRWSMGWFIFSEVMFFAAFFGALFYVRHIGIHDLGSADGNLFWPAFKAAWPTAGPLGELEMTMAPTISFGKSMLGLAFMVAAGAAVTYAHKPLEHGQRGQLQLVLVLTVVLVGLFLGVMTTDWLPAINTALLLASAATLTWAHWAIRKGDRKQFNIFLALTILLGLVFLGCQAEEYIHAYHEGLKLTSGIYGSTFFMMTGFHGLHVTIGVIMLIVTLGRSLAGHFSADRHFAFEAAAWYWHFVDYVWLLLFIVVYVL